MAIRILFSILTILAPILFFGLAANAKSHDFQWENELQETIQKEGLDQLIPKELANCDGSGDNVKMWTEFMKGLSYIESSWDARKDNPDDANGTPSKGLFQMTGGDTALGQNCFGTTDPKSEAPFDPIKNIQCAVKKMKELVSGQGAGAKKKGRQFSTASLGSFGSGGSAQMSGSLKEEASKYWGPLKEANAAHLKAEKLINDIAGNCGSTPFDVSVLEDGKSGYSSGGNSRRGNK